MSENESESSRTFVVLRPGSATNASDSYAVVRFAEWVAYSNGQRPFLEVSGFAPSMREAEALRDRLNARAAG